MPNEPKITDQLQQAKSGNRDAANVIINHFWATARQEARRNLTSAVRRIHSESDIANRALRSAISELEKPKSSFSNRDAFESLVIKIVRRKKKSAARHALAKKRDVRRTAPAYDDEQPKNENPRTNQTMSRAVREQRDDTANFVMAEELAKRVADIVNQEPDIEKRAVANMGVIDHLEPKEIVSILAANGAPGFALRTVQKIIEKAKERVAAALRDDYGKLLRKKAPKKSESNAPKKGRKNEGAKGVKKASKKVGKGQSKKKTKSRNE